MPGELRFPRSDSALPSAHASVADSESLRIAHACAARNWPVHPLAHGAKRPAANCSTCRPAPDRPAHAPTSCPCITAGRWCHGFHAATIDPARIQAWWGTRPDFGVGVACGPAHLVVIDVDAHQASQPSRDRILPGIEIGAAVNLTGLANGFQTLAVLAALRNHASPAEDTSTLRVRTPSGGMHIWYQGGDSRRWLCSSGNSAGRALAWQVDVRADGGYIIAPGTRTKAGTYRAMPGAQEPAPLPAWLAHELARTGHLHNPARTLPGPRPVPPRARQAVLAAGGTGPGADRLLATAIASVAECGRAPEGTGFSSVLNRAAFTLGGLVAVGTLTRDDAERLLRETAARVRPGQERRAAQIIHSGLAAGERHPLHPGSRP